MKDKKMHLTFEAENLAVPEIHTNEAEDDKNNAEKSDSGIVYDNLAMPEIHFRQGKKQNNNNKN